MSDISKEMQAFQAGLKLALPPKPQPEVKGTLFNTGIRPIVDDWLLNKAKEERDYGEYFSASSAGYCMRKVIFERLGVPKIESDGDARKQRVFTSGHIFHQWLQEITKEAGLSIAQELELQDEDLMIRGHIDDLVLVRYDENGETPVRMGAEQRASHLILYDYKTQNSRAFSYKRPNMSHYHKMQLGTYMYLLRKNMPNMELDWRDNHQHLQGLVKDLTEARILKISKDDLRMNEEQLMWTPDLEKEVVGYWRTLNGYWKSKKMPKCTCADYESGFMANEKWNGYFYQGEPCSLAWYEHCKKTELIKVPV